MSSTRRRSLFRPCIDLHNGQVKQIVGGTLSDQSPGSLRTNFVASYVQYIPSPQNTTITNSIMYSHPSAWFAELYKNHHLEGGHVIKLGSGNDDAAKEALAAWPGMLCAASACTSGIDRLVRLFTDWRRDHGRELSTVAGRRSEQGLHPTKRRRR